MKTNMPYPRPAIAWFAVSVLMLAYMFSFIDRLILSLLVEPIEADLKISDVQVSLLQGLTFALFYTIAGIPVGRLVDSHKRTNIICIGIVLWSLMTAITALANKYWQLFVTRAGVGIGEAALLPAAYSMIPDLFASNRRGLALGIFSAGSSIGAGLALIVGGYAIGIVNEAGPKTLPLLGTLEPWRLTFLYVGLPGLLVAILIKMVPEPKRQLESIDRQGARSSAIPLKEVLAHYKKNAAAITLHHLGMSFSAMAAYGIMAWAPVMLMRTQAWTPQQAGFSIGASIGIAGTLGVIGGGWLGDLLRHRGQVNGRINTAVLAMILAAIGAAVYPTQDSMMAIVAFFMLTMLGAFMVIGAGTAAMIDIMPNRLRGQATAVYLVVVSLAGVGLGPTIVAMFTDYVFGDPLLVDKSLFVVSPTCFAIAAACFWAARVPFAKAHRNPSSEAAL